MAEISACPEAIPGPRRQASIPYQLNPTLPRMTTLIVRVPPRAVHQLSVLTVSVAGRPPILVFAGGACQLGKPLLVHRTRTPPGRQSVDRVRARHARHLGLNGPLARVVLPAGAQGDDQPAEARHIVAPGDGPPDRRVPESQARRMEAHGRGRTQGASRGAANGQSRRRYRHRNCERSREPVPGFHGSLDAARRGPGCARR